MIMVPVIRESYLESHMGRFGWRDIDDGGSLRLLEHHRAEKAAERREDRAHEEHEDEGDDDRHDQTRAGLHVLKDLTRRARHVGGVTTTVRSGRTVPCASSR